MSKACFVAEIKAPQVDKLKTDLENQGFEIKSGPHLIFHASKKGIQVHLYQSLKLTVMGKDKDEFILFYLEFLRYHPLNYRLMAIDPWGSKKNLNAST